MAVLFYFGKFASFKGFHFDLEKKTKSLELNEISLWFWSQMNCFDDFFLICLKEVRNIYSYFVTAVPAVPQSQHWRTFFWEKFQGRLFFYQPLQTPRQKQRCNHQITRSLCFFSVCGSASSKQPFLLASALPTAKTTKCTLFFIRAHQGWAQIDLLKRPRLSLVCEIGKFKFTNFIAFCCFLLCFNKRVCAENVPSVCAKYTNNQVTSRFA